MSNDYGLKVSKEGVNVLTATPKDLLFSTQFNSVKIRETGVISLSLPSESFSGPTSYRIRNEYKTLESNFTEVAPLVFPRNYGTVAYVDGGVSSGASYVVNDLNEIDIPIDGYDNLVLEWVSLLLEPNPVGNNNRLILKVARQNESAVSVTFGARTVTAYYTIFYNQMNQEEDFL